MSIFSERIIKAALSIPKGRVTTYGRLAKASGGGAQSSRSVTAILAKAFHAGEVRIPFHRIVYADGRIWVSEKYRAKRMKLYKAEGIKVDMNDKIENFLDIVFNFI